MSHRSHRFSVVALLAASLMAPSLASAADSVEILQEFGLDQVTITDPYYKNLFDKDVAYFSNLDVDKLLAAFKAVSEGKDPGSAPGITLYGGWEGGWSLLRGHTVGHWLSAMARVYKQTKGVDQTLNDKIAQKIDYAIAQLKIFQDKSSKGYLFGSPESHFDVIEGKASGSKWAPWYTMHKIITGLLDAYKFEGNQTALAIASKLGDWTYARSSTWDANLRITVMKEEYGGMNDCLYELYKLTQKSEHLTAAHVFDEDTLFTPITEGKDNLSGLHANTQIPKFVGAVNRYRTVGASEGFYLTAAQQFWETVLKSHTYVTGGNSELEHFHEPGKLDAYRDNVNNETCNSYNMLRLTRELFKITGDVKYADYYERAHINEILAAINPETAMTMYFKPMGTGYFKLFGSEETFWCCNGTGMENYVKLNDSLYFHDDKDLVVNAYVSSKLTWTARGLSISLDTDLPLSEKVTVTVSAAPAEAAKIKFRKPYWVSSCGAVSVTVNGDAADAVEEKGYLAISRTWKVGDKIEVFFPMEVQVSRLPDNANAVAFMYGPIVLSAGLGTEKMESEAQWASAKATIPAGVVIQDTIAINSSTTINAWIANIRKNLVQTPGKLEFTLRNTDSDSKLTFTPHYKRYLDRYGIYFKLNGTAGGNEPAPTCPPRDAGVDTRPVVDAGSDSSVATGGNTATGGSGGNSGSASGGGGGSSSSGTAIGGAGGSTASASGGSGGASSSGRTGGSTGSSQTSGGGAGGSSAGRGGSSTSRTSGSGTGGSAGSSSSASSGSSGCSCALGTTPRREGLLVPLGLLGLLIGWRARKRR